MGQALEAAFSDDSGTLDSGTPDTPTADAQGEAGSSPATELSAATASPEAAPREPSPSTAPPPKGPIPWDDHDRVVKGFHKKLDEASEQLKAYSWAQQVPAEVGPRLVEMARRVQGDPVGFLMELASEVQNNPQHAPALRSNLGRLLGQRVQAQAPQVEMPAAARSGVPEVDQVLEARDKWLAEQLADQLATVVQERVGPLADLAQQVAQARERQQVEEAAKTWATKEMDVISKRPGFAENREAIAEAFAAEMRKIPVDQQDAHAATVLRDVYHDVVYPKLTTTSNAALLKTLTAKAVTSSLGAQPSVAAQATRPKSMLEALNTAGM